MWLIIAKAKAPVQDSTMYNTPELKSFIEHPTCIQANQFLQNGACTIQCTLKMLNKGMVAWENQWTNRVSNSRFAKCPAQQAATIQSETRFKTCKHVTG